MTFIFIYSVSCYAYVYWILVVGSALGNASNKRRPILKIFKVNIRFCLSSKVEESEKRGGGGSEYSSGTDRRSDTGTEGRRSEEAGTGAERRRSEAGTNSVDDATTSNSLHDIQQVKTLPLLLSTVMVG